MAQTLNLEWLYLLLLMVDILLVSYLKPILGFGVLLLHLKICEIQIVWHAVRCTVLLLFSSMKSNVYLHVYKIICMTKDISVSQIGVAAMELYIIMACTFC